jgi:glycine betaine/proline transport system substrate-binding protein
MIRLAALAACLVLCAAEPVLAQDSVITLGPGDLPGASSGDTATPAAATAADDTGASAEPAPPPPPCGTQPITIARMQWPSAELLAEIHARLLKAQFGCKVQVVAGDLAATASAMGANGQPAVAPELWITRIADIWNAAIKSQEVRQASPTYSDLIFEGWFVPDYVVAAHPELTSVAALKDDWKIFSKDGRKGTLLSCPPDWGCAVINRNLLRANGLTDVFNVIEPANRFELDSLIAEAVSRKEPILFYYWQPNAVLAQFAFKQLDLGKFDKDAFLCLGRVACADPKPSSYAPDPVVVGLSEWVYLEAPEVAAYFSRAKMPFAEMNALLQNLNEPGASIDSVADAFVAARGEIWRQWVGKP